MNQRGLQNLLTYLSILIPFEQYWKKKKLNDWTLSSNKEELSKLELFSYERSFSIQNWRQLKQRIIQEKIQWSSNENF